MANQIAALLGTKEGPWVYTGGFKNPRAKVSGLTGLMIIYLSEHPFEGYVCMAGEIRTDGEHPLKPARYMRFSAMDATKKLCCKVVAGD